MIITEKGVSNFEGSLRLKRTREGGAEVCSLIGSSKGPNMKYSSSSEFFSGGFITVFSGKSAEKNTEILLMY